MVLRKLVTSLFTGPLFVLAWILLAQILSLPYALADASRNDLVASLYLLGSYVYLMTYGLLCSFVIDLVVEKLESRFPSFIKLSLYLLAGMAFYAMMEPREYRTDPDGQLLIASLLCAIIFFAVEEALIRTGWLDTHKRLIITVSILLPLIISLRTGWRLLT